MRPGFGYFGKVPGARDFIFAGLPMRTADLWADRMAGWIAAGKAASRSDWPGRFLGAPAWRFVLAKDVIGPEAWIGLLAGSVDSVGREFPFTVMLSADIDPGELQPLRELDMRLDSLDEGVLAFIDGQIDQAQLMGSLGQAAADIGGDLKRLRAGGDAGPVLPRQDHEAVCFSDVIERGHSGVRYRHIHAWPASTIKEGRMKPCLWWHEGWQERPAEFCVTRGLPSTACAVSFFLGNWQQHGWQPCAPEGY